MILWIIILNMEIQRIILFQLLLIATSLLSLSCTTIAVLQYIIHASINSINMTYVETTWSQPMPFPIIKKTPPPSKCPNSHQTYLLVPEYTNPICCQPKVLKRISECVDVQEGWFIYQVSKMEMCCNERIFLGDLSFGGCPSVDQTKLLVTEYTNPICCEPIVLEPITECGDVQEGWFSYKQSKKEMCCGELIFASDLTDSF